jgi:hypothetical protein
MRGYPSSTLGEHWEPRLSATNGRRDLRSLSDIRPRREQPFFSLDGDSSCDMDCGREMRTGAFRPAQLYRAAANFEF